MNEQPTTNYMVGKRPRLSIRRAGDPPKNNEGQIYCDHSDCRMAPPTFCRPSEWKHYRPYKCNEPGCVMNRGFTYAGGLLRHQREVHKKHADVKKLLMCPYGDCNRSTGNGFARRENLHEHLRRRHRHTNNGGSRFVDASEWDGAKCLPAGRIRRRHDSPNGDRSELRNEVERLRHEVENKGRRLEELERMIVSLQQPIPQLPQLQYKPEPIEQTVSVSQAAVPPEAPTVKDFTADEGKDPGRIAGELKDQARIALEAHTRCFTTALGIAKTGAVKQATDDFVFGVPRSSTAALRSPHPEGSVRKICLLLGQYLEALMEMIQQARVWP
ncbi:hypothetical protein N7512_009377 [Penicillium capsulatum]|nr:hypothetical protein N7512_009377 [Penicillium capsulatum]